MDENLNPVNAEEVVEVVIPQENEQPLETEQTNNAEVVEMQQDTKVEQSKEDNSKFAEMRRSREAAEREAADLKRDYSIAKTYGKDYEIYSEKDIAEQYGHLGITNLEQFKEAIRQEEMKAQGLDPDAVKKYAEELPEVQEARKTKRNAENFSEFEKWHKDVIGDLPPLDKLPQPVIEAFHKGESMRAAFMEHDYKQIRTKQKAAEVNQANASSSTGSVTGNGSVKDVTLTEEMIGNMSDKERMSRWSEVKKVLGMK